MICSVFRGEECDCCCAGFTVCRFQLQVFNDNDCCCVQVWITGYWCLVLVTVVCRSGRQVFWWSWLSLLCPGLDHCGSSASRCGKGWSVMPTCTSRWVCCWLACVCLHAHPCALSLHWSAIWGMCQEQEHWENFLLLGQLFVLTLSLVSVPPLCYCSSM